MSYNCLNKITLVSDKLDTSYEMDLFINDLREQFSNENATYKNLYILQRGTRGIIFNFCNMWNGGDFKWLEKLLDKYRHCWVKNEWYENNGMSGVWVGSINKYNQKEVKQMSWNDLPQSEKKMYFIDV
jgi:hypothetical protein